LQYTSAWKQQCHVFLIISYVFSSTKSENKRAEQVLPGSGGWGWGAGGPMYTHASKGKNDKIKERKKKKESLSDIL
jgi:hypothetical protein